MAANHLGRFALSNGNDTKPPVDVTPTEAQRIKVWSDMLSVPVVTPTVDFVGLGRHSLMATCLSHNSPIVYDL